MKTDKKIENRIEEILENFSAEINVGVAFPEAVEELNNLLNTEVQNAREEAVKGYIEWFNNQDKIKENGIRLHEESAETYLQSLKENK